MDRERVMARVEQLLKEKHMSMNALMKETEISTTMYQWKKNASRDATRSPSLKSIEKICQFFGISLSYFFCRKRERRKRGEDARADCHAFPPEQSSARRAHGLFARVHRKIARSGVLFPSRIYVARTAAFSEEKLPFLRVLPRSKPVRGAIGPAFLSLTSIAFCF